MTRFNLDVKELEIRLEALSKERTLTNQFVVDTTAELRSLAETIENLQSQLTLLNGREEDIRSARGDEQIAYQHRTQNNNKVLAALNEVLKRLTEAVFSE
jgi:chromosome segregation ATPase